jgi:hypothetical protein
MAPTTDMPAIPFDVGDEMACKTGHDPYDERPRYRVVKVFQDIGVELTYLQSSGSPETVYLRPFMLIWGMNTIAMSVSGINFHRERYRWRNFHQSFTQSITMDDGHIYTDFIEWISAYAPECLEMATATRKPDPPLFQIEIKTS